MTAVFAADPGLTSGWATWDGTADRGQDREMELSDRLDAWLKMNYLPFGGPRLIVVYESYTITSQTAQKSQQPWSLELIGTARWLAHRYGAEFALQKPSEAKNFCPDARLRQLGLYVPGQDHARDALRHLVLACAKRRLIEVAPL